MSWPADGAPRFRVIDYTTMRARAAHVLDRAHCHRVVTTFEASSNSHPRLVRAQAEAEAERLERELAP